MSSNRWEFLTFKMADGRHFANHEIAISQRKIIRFRWKLLHKCGFRTQRQSRDQIYIYICFFFNSRWRMDAILKIVFGHNSAADIMISVKFCVKKQFFHRISVMGQILQFYRTDFFCFPNAVWASAISAFRIVSDTFVVKVYGNILASYIRQRRRLCFRPCLRVCVC